MILIMYWSACAFVVEPHFSSYPLPTFTELPSRGCVQLRSVACRSKPSFAAQALGAKHTKQPANLTTCRYGFRIWTYKEYQRMHLLAPSKRYFLVTRDAQKPPVGGYQNHLLEISGTWMLGSSRKDLWQSCPTHQSGQLLDFYEKGRPKQTSRSLSWRSSPRKWIFEMFGFGLCFTICFTLD